VWGVEADIAPTGFDTSKTLAGLGRVSASSDVAGTLRLRGGYAWNDLLLYATAGLALSDLEIKSSAGGKEDMGLAAPVLGLGAEYAWSDSWRLRVEGLVTGVDDVDVRLAGEKHEIGVAESSLRLSVIHGF
jgi:outer membrane immunogenic protein